MSKEYITTIGLEIHAELKTKTKMFCNSRNDPDEERPNVNICPICMGHPGTLPSINKEAVKHVLKMGIAVGGKISDFTEFDRKNYFYPDIPKGYQISQYKHPLVTGGKLNNVELTRIHLEEDTARSIHPVSVGASEKEDYSLVDFNRAGVPLMELVTEPVIHSAEEASAFAKELQLLLQYLGAGEANMEKGEMRVEANISVAPKGKRGTKVEVKNLNSFKAVEKAITFETKRHVEVLEEGGKIIQETRGWDETKEITFSQRLKEESHDYRYFPDPDLPKIYISKIPEFSHENLKKEIHELPWERRNRYIKKLEIKAEDAEIYVRAKEWGDYLESVIKSFSNDRKLILLASNYLSSDLAGLYRTNPKRWDESPIKAQDFADLVVMISKGEISSRGAKNILKIMFENGNSPNTIAESHNLLQQSGEETLIPIVNKIIADNQKAVLEYKTGKQASLQFLIGQAMKATKGSGNPTVLKDLFIKLIK